MKRDINIDVDIGPVCFVWLCGELSDLSWRCLLSDACADASQCASAVHWHAADLVAVRWWTDALCCLVWGIPGSGGTPINSVSQPSVPSMRLPGLLLFPTPPVSWRFLLGGCQGAVLGR